MDERPLRFAAITSIGGTPSARGFRGQIFFQRDFLLIAFVESLSQGANDERFSLIAHRDTVHLLQRKTFAGAQLHVRVNFSGGLKKLTYCHSFILT